MKIPKNNFYFQAINNLNQFQSIKNIEENNTSADSESSIQGLYRWEASRFPLKYYVQNNSTEKNFIPGFLPAVDSAFEIWTQTSNEKIKFKKVYNASEADIQVYWVENTVYGRDFEAGHNNLKIVNDKINFAEISIVVYPQIDCKLTPKVRIERVRRTALHEIGHALGLNHSNSESDIMFYRGINIPNPSSNDIRILKDLYKEQ